MFTPEDFKGETAQRLQVIIMHRMSKHPLTNFTTLMTHEKKKFNVKLNEYIADLPDEWELKILDDFHRTCNEEIFNEKFQAESHPPLFINTDLQLLPKEESI
jgi:hypothetical protein